MRSFGMQHGYLMLSFNPFHLCSYSDIVFAWISLDIRLDENDSQGIVLESEDLVQTYLSKSIYMQCGFYPRKGFQQRHIWTSTSVDQYLSFTSPLKLIQLFTLDWKARYCDKYD